MDPSQQLDGVYDVGIAQQRVQKIAPNLSTDGCPDVYDAIGMYVCPGLIDLHGHWYEGGLYGVHAGLCLNHGVTTAVDAGSTGFANFCEFRRTTMERSPVNLLGFVHISFLGLQAPFLEELLDLRYARPAETAETILQNREHAVGVKIRIGSMTAAHGVEALEMALQAANEARVPLMVHISKGADEKEILRRLRPGDILTHCFHGRENGLVAREGNGFIPLVGEARARGVLFDVGHGCGSFAWETAQKAFEYHFYPDTLSTDLHRYCAAEPLWVSLPDVMSKFLSLGMTLQDVILKTTLAPAKALHRETDIGTLRPGANADLFAFELAEGEFEFKDTHMRVRKGSRLIKPRLAVRNGVMYTPGAVRVQLRELYEFDKKLLNDVALGA
jgi:dihydroorotase